MMILLLGIVCGIVISVCEQIDNRNTVPDPRTPAQRRAMREDCRSKGL